MAKPMLGEIEGLGGPVVYAAMAAFVEIVASRLDATDERDSSPTRPLGGDTPRTPPFIARVALRLFDDITAARDTAVTTTVAPDVIAIGPECRWFQVSGHERIHIGRRKLLRRLLARLVEHRTTTPNDPIGVAELIEHCWPNEALVKGSGTNRVYVAVSKLRKMGLSDILLTRGDGYLLDHLTEIRREDS